MNRMFDSGSTSHFPTLLLMARPIGIANGGAQRGNQRWSAGECMITFVGISLYIDHSKLRYVLLTSS
ncbi:hypothetical protein M413DRAFT_346497 [Hebeloma cylindrosporum]|uniref:Uncharacterized protein n=1 Tax=Hebeloma cylindrosporum TaxID=76867 RepID=A0A0C3CNU2_HEBCY|nr:hypothetical protein M413DRAFT_346497 [Hebeloma cylindrosporum h7]